MKDINSLDKLVGTVYSPFSIFAIKSSILLASKADLPMANS